MLDEIEEYIDKNKKLSKETFKKLKLLVKRLLFLKKSMQKKNGKNKSMKVTRLKEKSE